MNNTYTIKQSAPSCNTRRSVWSDIFLRLFIVVAFLGSTSVYSWAGEIHLFFKKSDRGALYQINRYNTVEGAVTNSPHQQDASLYLPLGSPDDYRYNLSLLKSYGDLNKKVYIAARFSRTDRNNFLSKKRPWKELSKYKGSLISFSDADPDRAAKNYPNSSYLTRQINCNDLDYVVIEEFDLVTTNPLSVDIAVIDTPKLKLVDDSYQYLPTACRVRVTYKNAANYPIKIRAILPCVILNHSDTIQQETASGDHNFSKLPYGSFAGHSSFYGKAPFNGRTAEFDIPANGKVEITWSLNLNGIGVDINTKSMRIGVPCFNYTCPIGKSNAQETNLFQTKKAIDLVGTANVFSFCGGFPTELTSEPKKPEEQTIHFMLTNTNRLKTIQLYKSSGTKIGGNITLPKKSEDNTYKIDLSTLLSGRPAGDYYLNFTSDEGVSKKFFFKTSPTVEPIDPNSFATRLVIVQEKNKNQLLMLNFEPSGDKNKCVLMTITGIMEKETNQSEDVVAYTIADGALINGILKIRNKGAIPNKKPARIEWNHKDGKIKFETLTNNERDIYAVLDAYGKEVFVSSYNKQIQILLDEKQAYTNTYSPDDTRERIKIEGGTFLESFEFGDFRLATVTGRRLYSDGFAMSGRGEAGDFLSGMSKDYFNVEINIDDALFGENGFAGARGSVTDAYIGINDPFGIIGADAQGDLSFDVLPNSADRHFKMGGALNFLGIFTVTGEIGFRPIDPYFYREDKKKFTPVDLWSINDLYLEYDGTVGICDVTLGGGFSDIMRSGDNGSSGTEDYSFLYNPPPVEAKVRLGVGLSVPGTDADLISLKATGVAGGRRLGIIDGELGLFGFDLLEDVYGLYSMGATNYQGNSIPWFKFDLGGGMNIYNLIRGNANIAFNLDLAKSRHGLGYSWDMIQNLNKKSATEVFNFAYDVMDVTYSGKVALTVPKGVPFAGTEVGTASVSGNKDYIRAEATFKMSADAGPIEFDVDAYAWVQFKYSSAAISAGAGLRSAKNLTPGMPVYGYEYTLEQPRTTGNLRNASKTQSISFTSNIIPVQKSKKNIFLRAFGDGYSSSVTEPLAEEHNRIILRVRSKSNQTGLRLTTPDLGNDKGSLTANITAAGLNWKQALDENGDALDYYEISLPLSKTANNDYSTFVGDWKVETLNADASQLDENGEIEMEIFVALEAETVSNIAKESGNITFDTSNLDENADYRLSFALIADTLNNASIYPLGTTSVFSGNAVPASFALPDLNGNDFKTLNGNYYVAVNLEKYVGEVQYEGSEETFPSFEPTSKTFSRTTLVSHTNVKDPGAVSNVTATAVGSALAKMTWDAATNTNTNGFVITATDFDGKSSVFSIANANSREWMIRAGSSVKEEKDTLLVSVETDRQYAYSVKSYHALDSATFVYGVAASPEDSLLVPTPILCPLETSTVNFYVLKSGGKEVPVYNDNSIQRRMPAAVHGTMIYAQSTDTLILYSQFSSDLKMQRSKDGVNYTEISVSPKKIGFSLDQNALALDMGVANFPEDTIYHVQAMFLLGRDTTLYEFRVTIDNIPPVLMLTAIEKDTTTKNDRHVLSGTTEAGAELWFNDEDITESLTSKGFSIGLTPTTTAINFRAKDNAGNVTTGDYVISSDFLDGTDDTKSVRLLTYGGRFQFNLNEDNVVNIPVLVRRVDQSNNSRQITSSNTLDWFVNLGGNIASVTVDSDSTATITASGTGQVILMVVYKNLLADVVMFDIKPYNSANGAVMGKLSGSKSITLSYDEPQSPLNSSYKKAGRSSEQDWRQLEYSCDQITWNTVPHDAVTWHPADSASVDLEVAGIQSCSTGVMFFRLSVLEGPDVGVSLNTGVTLETLAGFSYTKKVSFVAEGFTSITEEVTFLSPVEKPKNPTRNGYYFDAWYKEPNFSTAWNFEDSLVLNDLTLYGKWIAGTPIQGISIGTFSGGTVTANKNTASQGETILLTVLADSEYELKNILAYRTDDIETNLTLTKSENDYTFAMPDYEVTIVAVFAKIGTDAETTAEAVESGTYSVTQAMANTETTVKEWLVNVLNAFFEQSEETTTLTGNMVTITSFVPAITGTEAEPNGTNGSFKFTIDLETGTTELITGTIVATVYRKQTGTKNINSETLQIVRINGGLQISGLVLGETFTVYDAQGQSIYQSRVVGTKTFVPLSVRGTYFIVTDKQAAKAIF